VHDAGSLAMQQITTVRQAEEAAAHGVDILVAQGGEAGGYGGVVATLALVPQVVDAVHPLPVVAAGGIADGRGFAAALVLGAAGVNIGSRFLACEETPISAAWKQALVDGSSEEWVQVEFLNVLSPNPGVTGYGTRVRARRNEFTEKWEQRRSELPEVGGELVGELTQAGKEGVDLMMVGGQSAGMITEVLPAAEVVRRLVAEAEDALAAGAALVSR
jgi:nitronate monooxygenase/enoyl-[acyl-carrier protein] reductase II